MEEKEILELLRKVLITPQERKKGDTPLEFYDLINKGYLQQSVTSTTSVVPATGTDIGRMVFNTSTNYPMWWNGSSWRKSDGTAA